MKLFQFLLLLCCSNLIYAQINAVNKGYAFYKAYLPGRQKVDENNNPVKPCVTLERTIYLECKAGTKLNIVKVCYNNFTLNPFEVRRTENKIVVGVKPSSGLPIIIKAKRGYIFWMLTLEPKCKNEKAFGKFLHYISIKTIAGLKPFSYLLKEETELVAAEMQ